MSRFGRQQSTVKRYVVWKVDINVCCPASVTYKLTFLGPGRWYNHATCRAGAFSSQSPTV